MQTSFFRNKVKRQIDYNGQDFSFTRIAEDKYHQSNISNLIEINVKGIYHEGISFVTESSTDAGRMRSKPQPMILMLYEDGKNLLTDDIVFIGDNKYKVIAKNDIKNQNVAYDVSLELVV